MPAFEGQGVKLFYEERGTGQPIVFVHGSICDYRAFSALTEALSSRFRTIAYSRRYAWPNGLRGNLMDSTIQNNSADLEALIKGLALGKVHLVGHSYGGFIAAYFATRHPELLRSLTLPNAAVATMLVPQATSAAALSLLLKSPRVAFSARRFIKATQATIAAVDSGDNSAAERIFVPAIQDGRTGLPAKPPGFSEMVADNAGTLKETTTQFPQVTPRQVMDITTPTMVVSGGMSAPWDSRISDLLSESIPGCERATIAGAGHFALMEKPGEVNDLMTSFLLKHS